MAAGKIRWKNGDQRYTGGMISEVSNALLALTLAPGLGPVLTVRALKALGSAQRVVEASTGELAGVDGIGRQRAAEIRRGLDEVAASGAVARERELIDRHGARLLMLEDAAYPPLLKHIDDPPPVLYVRGSLEPSDAVALALVGSRRCTAYGREQADRFAALAAQAGLCIVSGGAYGIDAAAHRAALRVQGRTIAVLGSGLARPYPTEHAPLLDQIANGHGAVISELPMQSPPLAENFPKRNRIISGLSLGVLVVEAALRSGALITARLAAEEHHREVLALPGRVDSAASAGCHKIIREGWATLVTNVADALDALGETGAMLKAGLTPESDGHASDAPLFTLNQNLTTSQKKIVEALDQPLALDQLAAATGLAVQTIQADLTMLQIRGLVARQEGCFARKHRP